MLLVDNNLSPRIAVSLKKQYKGIKHVSNVELGSRTDVEIWQYASNHHFHILTKDRDFNAL